MNFRFGATSWSSPLPYNSRCSVRLVWPLAHEIIRATIIYCYQGSCFWPVGAFVPSQSRSVEGSGVSRVSPGNRTRNPSSFFFFPLPSSIRAIFLHGRETAPRVILSAISSIFARCVLRYLKPGMCIEIPPHMCWMLLLFLFFTSKFWRGELFCYLSSFMLRIFNRIIFFFFKDHLEKIIF